VPSSANSPYCWISRTRRMYVRWKPRSFMSPMAATMLRIDPIALLYVATVLAQRLDSANRGLLELKRQVQGGDPRSVRENGREDRRTAGRHGCGSLFGQLFAQAMWSPTRLTRQQSRLERARVAECRYRLRAGFRGVLFHQERARRAATCAQELISVMDVYLARACS
jgi:hypothetical protein